MSGWPRGLGNSLQNCQHRFESGTRLKIKFIEIYLVVNQLALGCRIWNADNVGSSPIY